MRTWSLTANHGDQNANKKAPVSRETTRKPKNEQVTYGISTLYHFDYDPEVQPCFALMASWRTPSPWPAQPRFKYSFQQLYLIYSELGVPLKLGKMVDIKKTFPYVSDEHKLYLHRQSSQQYDFVHQWWWKLLSSSINSWTFLKAN